MVPERAATSAPASDEPSLIYYQRLNLSAANAIRQNPTAGFRLIGLRDRALIALLLYTFARVSAAINMDVEDYTSSP